MNSINENPLLVVRKPFHYILMLEGSGGMAGKIWKDLLDGLNEFLKIRMSFGLPDRITIIVFDHTAVYIYLDADIQIIDITRIRFPSGGREFAGAFNLVIQAIMSTLYSSPSINLEYSIIFTSDGSANFPSLELGKLLTMKARISHFWTLILDGPGTEISEEINRIMGGTLKKFKSSAEFVPIYAEIAHN